MPPLPTRLDINDPKDVQYLVDTGLAWRSGPQTMQAIFRLIQNGDVTRRPSNETPPVTAYLDKVAPVAPVEQPTVDMSEPPVADNA